MRRTFMGWLAALASLFGSGRAFAVGRPVPRSEALDALLADFPFRVVTVPGHAALAEWQRLRAAGEGWPVVVGDDEALTMVVEVLEFNTVDERSSVEAILAAADAIDVPKALRQS